MSNAPYDRVFVGCPSHDGRLDMGAGQAIWAAASEKRVVLAVATNGSLLSMNCNGLWCDALNMREEHRLGWFAMLHSDISPDRGWVDTLIDEAEKYGADLMSAVVPIKDNRGITSTAIDNPSDPWIPWCRITMKQLWHEGFPETFDFADAAEALGSLPEPLRVEVPKSRLLVNTGCFVARLGQPWNDRVYFQNFDGVRLGPDGKRCAIVQPEDWVFARMAADAGAKVMATRKLRLKHRGGTDYPSFGKWGVDRDADCERERLN